MTESPPDVGFEVIKAGLLDFLRSGADLSAMEVTAALLRVCRELAVCLGDGLQRRFVSKQRREPYRARVETIVIDASRALDPEFLDPDECAELVRLIEESVDQEDFVLRARDAATVIDARRGAHFFARLNGQRFARLAGDPIPIAAPSAVAAELGRKHGLTPAPDSVKALNVPLDGTTRLRLCPEGLGELRLVLDTRFAGLVDDLFSGERQQRVRGPGPSTVWSAVVPTCDWRTDLTSDPIDDTDPPGFYGVRPTEPGAAVYRQRVLDCLAAAVASGASIIVLPELVSDELCEGMIENWFAGQPSIALLVAGSRHLVGESRRNRARVLLRGMGPAHGQIVHDKFSWFSIEIEGVMRTEVIERPNELTIIAGRRWSFSPLICKDFMDSNALRILAEARVRAVLVASMSPKTHLYERDAVTLAQHAQALVFIANVPHAPEDAVAILAVPTAEDPAVCKEQHATGIIALIRTDERAFSSRKPLVKTS